MRLRSFVPALPLFVVCLAAKADTILFDQPFNTDNLIYSNAVRQQLADSFTLSSTSTINSVTFYGAYTAAGPLVNTFLLTLYAADAGLPGAVLETVTATTSKTTTGSSLAGFTIYGFNAVLPSFTAVGGATYFFSTASTASGSGFAWSSSDTGNQTSATRQSATSPYYASSDNLAFTLSGTVAPVTVTPEPSGFLLLGTGLLGVVGAANRRFA